VTPFAQGILHLLKLRAQSLHHGRVRGVEVVSSKFPFFTQFRLTRRVSGKTVTESFPNPTALRKAQQEVAEFHRFQQLSEDLVTLNEEICRLRPVEQQRGGWTEQEKKRLLRSIRRWRGK
jgi:hypothetical protein